jgi:hypothetical protein
MIMIFNRVVNRDTDRDLDIHGDVGVDANYDRWGHRLHLVPASLQRHHRAVHRGDSTPMIDFPLR